MSDEQMFLWGTDVKSALREFVEFYANHEVQLAKQGSMSFVRYPPLELNTVLHEVYDRLMPSWRREAAKGPPPPISKEENDRIMEELRPMREAIDKLRKGL